FCRCSVSNPCAVIPRGSETATPILLAPTSSPRTRPAGGLGALPFWERIYPVSSETVSLGLESTARLYAPDSRSGPFLALGQAAMSHRPVQNSNNVFLFNRLPPYPARFLPPCLRLPAGVT